MHFLFRVSSTLALRTPLLDNILLPAIRARRWTGSALRRALFVTLPAVLAVCWSGPARGQTNVLSVVRPLDGYTQGATTNALVQVGGNFYGTTVDGGSNNIGTVYQLTPQGIYTLLYSFTGGSDGSVPLRHPLDMERFLSWRYMKRKASKFMLLELFPAQLPAVRPCEGVVGRDHV